MVSSGILKVFLKCMQNPLMYYLDRNILNEKYFFLRKNNTFTNSNQSCYTSTSNAERETKRKREKGKPNLGTTLLNFTTTTNEEKQ